MLMYTIFFEKCALEKPARFGEKFWGYDTQGSRVITDLSTN
jgi:hypothetical protein